MAAVSSQPSRPPPSIHQPLDPLSNANTPEPANSKPPPPPRSSISVDPPSDASVASHHNYRQHHHSNTLSTSSLPKSTTTKPPAAATATPSPPATGGGLFAFASAAFDRTQSAFAGISEQRLRPRQSLGRLSISTDLTLKPSYSSLSSLSSQSSPDKISTRNRISSHLSLSPGLSSSHHDAKGSSQTSLRDPPSQPYTETDPNRPPPIYLPRLDNKMHQTSSRLLRMTDDDRPFTKVGLPQLIFFYGCCLLHGSSTQLLCGCCAGFAAMKTKEKCP